LDDKLELTESGREAAKCPVDPIWFYTIMKGIECRCAYEVVAIAALMSTQNTIFLRPHAFRYAADLVREQFAHPLSDHLMHLNAFHAYVLMKDEGNIDPAQWCEDHFLSMQILEEVCQIREGLMAYLRSTNKRLNSTPFKDPNYAANIRKALALGHFLKTAIKFKDTNYDVYKTVPGNHAALLHQESTQVGERPEWVVYGRFIHTGKQYIQHVTVIDPRWIKDLPAFQDDRLRKYESTDFKQPYVRASLEKARTDAAQADQAN
jgi:pre-mRNA-splicing factor ATP-dependent RNA helicase DHX15/PRP43